MQGRRSRAIALFPPPSLLPRRTLILRQPNSTVLAFWALPALVFKTIIIDIFFILYKVSVDTVSTWVGYN